MLIPILLTVALGTTSLPANQPYVQMISAQALMEVPVSTTTVHEVLIPFYANLYDVPVQEMDDIVKCESYYGEYAKGDYQNGEPTSFGLAQLHNPLSKGITVYEAYNAMFSLNYMAQALKSGTDHWSCGRITGWTT